MKKTTQEITKGFNKDMQEVPLEKLLSETSYIEDAPYHIMKEEKSFSGDGLEKYINTTVGNHATCQTTSCRAKPITLKAKNKA